MPVEQVTSQIADDVPCFNKDERYAAKFIGTSLSTVRRFRAQNRGPRYKKIGGYLVRYSLESLQEWVKSQPSGGEPA